MHLLPAQFVEPGQCQRLIRGALTLCVLAAVLGLGLAFGSRSQEPQKGLSKDQVLKLLKEDPAPRVQYLVNKYGIEFSMTPDAESDLRDAGATADLIDLIRRLAPEKPVEVKLSLPLPPTLVVNAKPGESEVYVDDERRGQTGTDGVLRLGDLTAGAHKVRISSAGFHSYEVSLELIAGQTNTLVAELQPVPPPAPPIDTEPVKEAVKPETVASEKPRGDPDDPLTPHAPGVYYFEQSGGAHHLVELEEAPPTARTLHTTGRSALGAFGGFAGPKWKSMVFGGKAHLRIPAGRPVFYFYFPTAESDASVYGLPNDAFRHTSTPHGFVLVRLESHKNEREIPAKGNATATVDEKDTEPFDYQNTAMGIYKVELKSDLGPGEYGFLFGGMLQVTAQTWLFDFGVDKPK